MIPDSKLKISFQQLAIMGEQILAKQPVITMNDALEQIKRVKENSKVAESIKKKGRSV